MPVYLSDSLIEQLLEQTDHFIGRAKSNWQTLPSSIFEAKRSPAEWSANQCLVHLISYGNYYLPEIEKAIKLAKVKGQLPSRQFKTGWLGSYFTNILLPDENGRAAKRMKSPKDHHPLENVNSALVITTFIEQQEKLLSLLKQAKQIDLNKPRIPISLTQFVRLKLGDVILFLVAHNSRHILQAERALATTDLSPTKSLLFSIKAIETL